MSDIKDHTWERNADGTNYGTIGNHSSIHLTGAHDSVSIGRVEDHCNVSGDCKVLSIGSMADHVLICTTGAINHGGMGDHCSITENASPNDLVTWRAQHDRSDPGN